MGRKKQSNPQRSGGLVIGSTDSAQPALGKQKAAHKEDDAPYFVQLDTSCSVSNEHHDVSEVVLTDLKFRQGVTCFAITDDFYQDSKYYLRFQVPNSSKVVGRIRLGHCPVLSSAQVSLELAEKCTSSDSVDMCSVILSGIFDGPDDGISGLVHLASLKLVTLRPVFGTIDSEGTSSLRVRVEILRSAFDECESLLEVTRQLWKKSMMNVMAWLRPEVLTSEARYGMGKSIKKEVDVYPVVEDESSGPRKLARFDVAEFYEAIKPSKESLMLEDEILNLLPVLRPYQRRAAYWMVQREKGNSGSLDEKEWSQFLSPLCIPVGFLDSNSKMYYNPFSGNISLHPEPASPHICGGILADEMGLGKTVELLACVFAHRKPESEDSLVNATVAQANEDDISLKRLKRERVECICGAVSESRKYKGLWVQCDVCDAWQHAECVGYSASGKAQKASKISDDTSQEQNSPVKPLKRTRKNDSTNIVVREGDHICHSCSELLQAINSPISTGATLIVCPAPILSQWHAEIIRHTRPGSLKTYIYEGVRSSSLSNTSGAAITELVNADIVLTTYDVLKEDLSHDSDRHEGDRRFLRFEKRYPVIPTLLTRVFWWRICLDEAQMVESNTAAATEMALRLYAKHRWCITGTPIQRKLDDLYGLLRFLKASPFNASRWWVEVIRDPYEKRDEGALEFTQKLFKQLMWRSSKVHVADDLQLPPQEECLSWLTFSPIEEHFYQRQHETCVSYAREVVESLKEDFMREVSGNSSFDPLITDLEAEKLLSSLLKLRQACCHPQVGSFGLRSLQQSPMTMEEILKVLISKTKIEGEDALRKLVSSLNGLAGIAIIQQDLPQAVSLYKEALSTTHEHSEDFRLDPLLNIHIHHNLAEILQEIANATNPPHSGIKRLSESIQSNEQHNQKTAKRQKMCGEEKSDSPYETGSQPDSLSEVLDYVLNGEQEYNVQCNVSLKPLDAVSLRKTCESLKQKYLTTFTAKLSAAQQEFSKSHMQVCSAFNEIKNQQRVWWLEALHHAEQNKDLAGELIRKIEESISGSQRNQRSSRMTSRFRSITGLKYHVQTGLDLLEESRKKLIDRIQEIDQTMENPSEEDIKRVRYCRTCQVVGDGPMCVHCELDELFQDYEARLFRVNKSDGEMVKSAEEAVDLRKKKSALDRFYWNLSGPNKSLTSTDVDNEDLKRDVGEKVIVSKSPSILEVALGVIKGFCKAQFGRDGISAATKQLLILEGMRKEYRHARQLSLAQAQVFRAHDEIKMATTRLRVREDENDNSIDALSSDELASASVENSSEKFMSSTLLSSTKGKLRYLKGLALSKNKPPTISDESSITQQLVSKSISTEQKDTCSVKVNEEACPICHEKLSTQKMVFQCGHITCCKCLFAMTEQRLLSDNIKSQNKWVMCPVCRQHTDVRNIAYADDRDSKLCSSALPPTNQGGEYDESLIVEGSYGTKIEAVTRRILWIKSTDAKAKVLVFSSWNDVLDVLEHAFASNSISYIRMKGGRKSHAAISEFRGQSVKGVQNMHSSKHQEQNHVQVLLLLIQHGANGLNLLEAQHVILVEPLLNPAVEAQAISRVHRIGQDKRTLVHRFIVKNTVEESIYKLNRSRNSESFISWNTKNQDQPVLTLKDVESLFAVVPSPSIEANANEKATECPSLRHLPPSEAAAIAAERRLKESMIE